MTSKGKYLGDEEPGWRLVAVLDVTQRFSTHAEAADWYARQGKPLPSNCLTPQNAPKSFELTNRRLPNAVKERLGRYPDHRLAIRLWDATYQVRVRECPVFIVTKPVFRELFFPPQLREHDFLKVFGKIPGMQNPPRKTRAQMECLMNLATRRHDP